MQEPSEWNEEDPYLKIKNIHQNSEKETHISISGNGSSLTTCWSNIYISIFIISRIATDQKEYDAE